ncbi:GntR family transcriptional regulator [Kineosporia rhizophila]|uniref:GntR family transcriptional regulator n=1 Tax=Kineosporia TaxID=49184 RepID=UPI001E5817EC|nr:MULTISPECIES: GntR family transcriptional regulator [Kineosporia]MCE0537405.1 GntR family transcriptional regulator [Kineosporia rhizophila]GLY17445.1 GntR family transcriptional regulator [Kineosporia sp. NBRC 101677]
MASPRNSTYGAMAAALREAIRRGDFAGGVRLPTEAELADTHQVSRQTVRRAMQELVSEGLVDRVPGRGTYAVDRSERYLRHIGSVEELMSLSVDTEAQILHPLRTRTDAAAAARLELDGDDVGRLSFARTHGGVTFCHTEVSLPPTAGEMLVAAAPELARPGHRSAATVIGLLEQHLGRPIRDAEQTVTAAPCAAGPAEVLACPPGSPVLRIERLYRDGTGRPLELAVSHFDPQHYSYRIRLRRHG